MRISKSKWSRRLSPAELGLLAEQIHFTIKRDIVVRGEHLMRANIELNHSVCFLCLFLDMLKGTSVHYAMHVYIVLGCPVFLGHSKGVPEHAAWAWPGLLWPQGMWTSSFIKWSLKWMLLVDAYFAIHPITVSKYNSYLLCLLFNLNNIKDDLRTIYEDSNASTLSCQQKPVGAKPAQWSVMISTTGLVKLFKL